MLIIYTQEEFLAMSPTRKRCSEWPLGGQVPICWGPRALIPCWSIPNKGLPRLLSQSPLPTEPGLIGIKPGIQTSQLLILNLPKWDGCNGRLNPDRVVVRKLSQGHTWFCRDCLCGSGPVPASYLSFKALIGIVGVIEKVESEGLLILYLTCQNARS